MHLPTDVLSVIASYCVEVVHMADKTQYPVFEQTIGWFEGMEINSLDYLQHLYANKVSWGDERDGILLCSVTAACGNCEILQYLHHIGTPWGKQTFFFAAVHNQWECLMYAYNHGCPYDGNDGLCNFAARTGLLNCLQYAHENGHPWNEITCNLAAENGRVNCLEYMHKNGCPWGIGVGRLAAWYGRLTCLEYLHDNNYPWDEQMYSNARYYFTELEDRVEVKAGACLEYVQKWKQEVTPDVMAVD